MIVIVQQLSLRSDFRIGAYLDSPAMLSCSGGEEGQAGGIVEVEPVVMRMGSRYTITVDTGRAPSETSLLCVYTAESAGGDSAGHLLMFVIVPHFVAVLRSPKCLRQHA